MKKLLMLLVAFALVATACSSAQEAATGSNAESEAEPAASVAADDVAERDEEPAVADTAAATGDDGGEPTSVPAASAPLDEAACGFDTADFGGEYVETNTIESTPDEDVPSAIVNPLNLNHPEPLVDVSRIRSGGPPPDGIPPIDTPRFLRAHEVDFLACNEPVVVLEVNGESRAYPIQIMTWHEIVNDSFGDVPVTVSYCPLCNSALVYDRRVGDRVLDFGTSGSLFNSSLVMYDRQTGTLWTHFDGRAVVGHMTGAELDLLPVQTLPWRVFLESHPDGLVLSRQTGFVRDYGRNPYRGYDDPSQFPFLFDGEVDESELSAKTRVVAIREGDASVVIPLDALAEAGVIATELNGDPITVWHQPGLASALDTDAISEGRDVGAVGVFRATVGGDVLQFNAVDGRVFDTEGDEWNIQGEATNGVRRGTKLESVEHLDTFWFAIAAFSPDSTFVTS